MRGWTNGKDSITCLVMAALLAVGSQVGPAEADVITVCPDGSGDYVTIQEGIDAASNGDEVVVCDGTYTGALNKNLDFAGKAITVHSANGPENCIIDCEASEQDPHRGFHFHSGEDWSSVVDGFTVINAYTSVSGFEYGSGGAILCNESSPTITNCVFSGNYANSSGAGIAVWACSPRVVGCTFRENEVLTGGGVGIVVKQGGNLTVTNCTFIGNTGEPSMADGGGIFVGDSESTATVTNCTFCENQVRAGGAIHCQGGGTVTVINCTMSRNSSASGLGGGISGNKVTIANSILWDNIPNEIVELGGDVVATYSDVEGGWPGEGNIDADPLFVDPDNCDLHLQPGSPYIDAGNNTAVPAGVTTDLDGNPRFVDDPCMPDTGVPGNGFAEVVDMGAYEYQDMSCQRGDLNCDGVVDGFDIDPFILAVLSTPPDHAEYYGEYPDCDVMLADIDGSGHVDGFDIDPFVELLTAG